MEFLYRSDSVYLWCSFASNPIVLLKGSMNTRRNATPRFEDQITNAGSHPRGEKVPPLEEDANVDQDPIKSSPLTDGDIRVALIQFSQEPIVQALSVTAHAN